MFTDLRMGLRGLKKTPLVASLPLTYTEDMTRMLLKLLGPAGNSILRGFVDLSFIDVVVVEVPIDEY